MLRTPYTSEGVRFSHAGGFFAEELLISLEQEGRVKNLSVNEVSLLTNSLVASCEISQKRWEETIARPTLEDNIIQSIDLLSEGKRVTTEIYY